MGNCCCSKPLENQVQISIYMGNCCCSKPFENQDQITIPNEPCRPMSGEGKAEGIEVILNNPKLECETQPLENPDQISINNEPKPKDIEGILIKPKSEYDYSGLSMIDLISNLIVIVDTVIKVIQNNLAKSELLKAVCRRMLSLKPFFEELKSKNSSSMQDLVKNLIHIVNRIKKTCEKTLAGKSSIWEKFKDILSARAQIEELRNLNDLLTDVLNNMNIPIEVETQKKIDLNFKKNF